MHSRMIVYVSTNLYHLLLFIFLCTVLGGTPSLLAESPTLPSSFRIEEKREKEIIDLYDELKKNFPELVRSISFSRIKQCKAPLLRLIQAGKQMSLDEKKKFFAFHKPLYTSASFFPYVFHIRDIVNKKKEEGVLEKREFDIFFYQNLLKEIEDSLPFSTKALLMLRKYGSFLAKNKSYIGGGVVGVWGSFLLLKKGLHEWGPKKIGSEPIASSGESFLNELLSHPEKIEALSLEQKETCISDTITLLQKAKQEHDVLSLYRAETLYEKLSLYHPLFQETVLPVSRPLLYFTPYTQEIIKKQREFQKWDKQVKEYASQGYSFDNVLLKWPWKKIKFLLPKKNSARVILSRLLRSEENISLERDIYSKDMQSACVLLKEKMEVENISSQQQEEVIDEFQLDYPYYNKLVITEKKAAEAKQALVALVNGENKWLNHASLEKQAHEMQESLKNVSVPFLLLTLMPSEIELQLKKIASKQQKLTEESLTSDLLARADKQVKKAHLAYEAVYCTHLLKAKGSFQVKQQFLEQCKQVSQLYQARSAIQKRKRLCQKLVVESLYARYYQTLKSASSSAELKKERENLESLLKSTEMGKGFASQKVLDRYCEMLTNKMLLIDSLITDEWKADLEEVQGAIHDQLELCTHKLLPFEVEESSQATQSHSQDSFYSITPDITELTKRKDYLEKKAVELESVLKERAACRKKINLTPSVILFSSSLSDTVKEEFVFRMDNYCRMQVLQNELNEVKKAIFNIETLLQEGVVSSSPGDNGSEGEAQEKGDENRIVSVDDSHQIHFFDQYWSFLKGRCIELKAKLKERHSFSGKMFLFNISIEDLEKEYEETRREYEKVFEAFLEKITCIKELSPKAIEEVEKHQRGLKNFIRNINRGIEEDDDPDNLLQLVSFIYKISDKIEYVSEYDEKIRQCEKELAAIEETEIEYEKKIYEKHKWILLKRWSIQEVELKKQHLAPVLNEAYIIIQSVYLKKISALDSQLQSIKRGIDQWYDENQVNYRKAYLAYQFFLAQSDVPRADRVKEDLSNLARQPRNMLVALGRFLEQKQCFINKLSEKESKIALQNECNQQWQEYKEEKERFKEMSQSISEVSSNQQRLSPQVSFTKKRLCVLIEQEGDVDVLLDAYKKDVMSELERYIHSFDILTFNTGEASEKTVCESSILDDTEDKDASAHLWKDAAALEDQIFQECHFSNVFPGHFFQDWYQDIAKKLQELRTKQLLFLSNKVENNEETAARLEEEHTRLQGDLENKEHELAALIQHQKELREGDKNLDARLSKGQKLGRKVKESVLLLCGDRFHRGVYRDPHNYSYYRAHLRSNEQEMKKCQEEHTQLRALLQKNNKQLEKYQLLKKYYISQCEKTGKKEVVDAIYLPEMSE